MKKTAAILLLFLAPLFALYQFNASTVPTDYINTSADYPNSEPGMLFYKDGSLYFTDMGAPGVFIYKIATNETVKISAPVSTPYAVYVGSGNEIYISDGSNGFYRRSPPLTYTASGGLHGIALVNDTFFTTDFRNGRLYLIRSDGLFSNYFGSNGTLNGNFNKPEDLRYVGGMVYVADAGNHRIEAYYPNLTYYRTYGAGQGGLSLAYPRGLFIDDNYIYVADSDGGKVAAYTMDGYPIYIYSVEDPRGIALADGKMYVSQGGPGYIRVFNFTLAPPQTYVQPIYESLAPAFSKYYANSYVAVQIGVAHNRTLATDWGTARLALENKAWGEAFYKLSALASANVTGAEAALDSGLAAKLSSLAQNSSAKEDVLAMAARGDYAGAYGRLNAAPQLPPGNTANETNVANATKIDTAALVNRLAEAKRLIVQYRLNVSASDAGDAVDSASQDQNHYDSASLVLDALDERINLQVYQINVAQEKVSALRDAIAKNELFVDYSRASEDYAQASALLYSEPDKARSLAEEGLSEIQKSESSASAIYLAAAALAGLAVVVVLGFYLLHDKLLRKDEYHFQGGNAAEPPNVAPKPAPKQAYKGRKGK